MEVSQKTFLKSIPTGQHYMLSQTKIDCAGQVFTDVRALSVIGFNMRVTPKPQADPHTTKKKT